MNLFHSLSMYIDVAIYGVKMEIVWYEDVDRTIEIP